MSQNWEPNSIVASGAAFNYYRTAGPKDSGKPVLVLQHGFSDNGRCWIPVAEELAADYDIIMPDARGHGLSARVEPGEAIDQAADLAAVMQALGVEKAVVGGHSMGAQIASQLGARFPERVSALILEDPPWFPPQPEAGQGGRTITPVSSLGQWLIGLRDLSLEQIMAQSRQEHPTWPESYLRFWCQAKLEIDLNFLKTEAIRLGWQEQVPCLQCPTLLVTADPSQGGIVSPDLAAKVQEMNPRIRVANFAGVGHHVRFAVHNAYMQTIKTFLGQVV